MTKYSRSFFGVRHRTCLAPLLFFLFQDHGAAKTPAEMDDVRMAAVVQFAETVLKHGRDRYGEKHTPLFTDNLDVDTLRAPERMYIYRLNKPGPRQWQPWQPVVSSNLSYQGNLMRTLSGLSKLTGNAKYADAYKESLRYYFAHYQNQSGMLHMGHHRFIDLVADRYDGDDWPSGSRGHEMKGDYPYYDLFWETDREATQRMLDGHWNSHLKNWESMDFTRHGYYGRTLQDGVWDRPMAAPVKGIIKGDLTFFGSFSDIAWAGGSRSLLSNNDKARLWTQRLFARYIDSAHEKTGIPPCHHTEAREFAGANGYPNEKWPEYALLLSWNSQMLFGHGATMLMRLGESFGEKDGAYFRDSVRDYLKAYARHAYDPKNNSFRAILYDGKDLSKHQRKGDGPSGLLFPPWQADGTYLLSYSLCYRQSEDPEIRKTLQTIFRGNGLGELDQTPTLNFETKNSDPLAIFALVELFQCNENRAYLDLARVVANNALAERFDTKTGLFIPSPLHKTANLNEREPLAFLTLEAALQGKLDQVPTYDGSTVGQLFNILRSPKVLPYSPTASHCWHPNTVSALCDELVPKSSNDTSIPAMSWYRGRHKVGVVATFPDILEKPATIEGPRDVTDAPHWLKGITIDSRHRYTFVPPGSLQMNEDFTLTVLRGDHLWNPGMAWYLSGNMNYHFEIAAGSKFDFGSVIYEYDHPNTRAGLIKNGEGTLILSGNHGELLKGGRREDDRAYRGATEINAGTLLANNKKGSAISPLSPVTVKAGATLGGTGAIGNGGTSATVTVEADGSIAPGAPPGPPPTLESTTILPKGGVGTLTLRDGLPLNDGAHLSYDLGEKSDLLKVTGGTFTGASKGGVKVSLNDPKRINIGATYDLIDWTGAKAEGVDVEDFTFARSTLYFGEFRIEDSRLKVTITSLASAPVMKLPPASSRKRATTDKFTWSKAQGGEWTVDENWQGGAVPNGKPREWAVYLFKEPRVVSGFDLYWLDDGGAVRVPQSWRVLYRADGKWKPVELAPSSKYGVAKDTFNAVECIPVRTDGLRLEVDVLPEHSAGVLEWRVR